MMTTVALTILAGMIVAMFLGTTLTSLLTAFQRDAGPAIGNGRRIFY